MPRRQLQSGDIKRRFLLFAGPKVGKTWTIAKIIEQVHEQNPRARHYLMDTEDGWEQSTEELPAVKSIPDWFVCANRVEFARDFSTIREEIETRYRQYGVIQDWLYVDSISDLWEIVQVDYAREIFGQELGEKFFEMRKAAEEAKARGDTEEVKLDGWGDWAIMKRQHNTDIVDQMKRLPCNWVITAKAKELMEKPKTSKSRDMERAAIRMLYDEIGYKPEGEWGNSHRVDSIWFLHKRNSEGRITYLLTSIGERGTVELKAKRIKEGSSAYHVWMASRPILPVVITAPTPPAEPSLDELLGGL